MKYIINLTDEPKELPSIIGATVINNPDEETILSLGLIPINTLTVTGEWSEDKVYKLVWKKNENVFNGITAFYEWEIDEAATRNRFIQEENTRYMNDLEEGFDTGLGFNISMHKNARDLFREIMDGIYYAELPDDTIYSRLKDTQNNYHSVSVSQLKAIAKGYSLACMHADGLNDFNLDLIT